jgi:peptidoglycan/xylan/chitin deacetylase (PgdA/CDA1 family)
MPYFSVPSAGDRNRRRASVWLVSGCRWVAGVFGTACLIAGCGSGGHSKDSAASVLAARPAATKAPTPTPTPTPDPQAVPSWSRGQVVRSVPVKKDEKVFALTFDDGPWPESTRQVLRILADNNVKATFYMVGQEVLRRPEIAREVRDAGHAIGNHSWDHPSRPRDATRQVVRTDNEIKKVLGFAPTTFRPPYGLLKNGMARQAMRDGQPVLLWSADSTDWSRPGVARIASRVLNQAGPGGIALMHDGGGPRGQTIAALPRIIDGLRSRGYRFVTVPELLKMRYIAPKPKPKSKSSTASTGKPKSGSH